MVSALSGGLWSLVGLLSGAVLGLSLGLSPRFVIFLAILGLAIGWFGFSGTYGRINGKTQPKLLPVGQTPESPLRKNRLTGEEARAWLDDFLVKQQGK